MNDPKSLLTRWSRRKQVAAATDETKSLINERQSSVVSSAAHSQVAVESARAAVGAHQGRDGVGLSSAAVDSIDRPFDPLSVPPVESIIADTDIRGFLVPGVPPELTRAALRRAWAADPKVRDFVGLADYDWDFNTPGSMAGFGSLEMNDDLRRVAVQILGGAPSPGEPDLTAQAQPVHEVESMELAKNAPLAATRSSGEAEDLRRRDQENGSAPHEARKPENSQLVVRHSHGGALPK